MASVVKRFWWWLRYAVIVGTYPRTTTSFFSRKLTSKNIFTLKSRRYDLVLLLSLRQRLPLDAIFAIDRVDL